VRDALEGLEMGRGRARSARDPASGGRTPVIAYDPVPRIGPRTRFTSESALRLYAIVDEVGLVEGVAMLAANRNGSRSAETGGRGAGRDSQ
jgi:hypothetical protein